MTKCPKCQIEITHLLFWGTMDKHWRFNGDGFSDAQVVEESGSFLCPECLEELCIDEAEVQAFLKEARCGSIGKQ
jgi:predicted RNA-binding Zn-ribbon protein involved in translation (DUF1610 family)